MKTKYAIVAIILALATLSFTFSSVSPVESTDHEVTSHELELTEPLGGGALVEDRF